MLIYLTVALFVWCLILTFTNYSLNKDVEMYKSPYMDLRSKIKQEISKSFEWTIECLESRLKVAENKTYDDKIKELQSTIERINSSLKECESENTTLLIEKNKLKSELENLNKYKMYYDMSIVRKQI